MYTEYMWNESSTYYNLAFAAMLFIAAYLLLDHFISNHSEREKAARLAFRIAIREGRPRKDARRAYKAVKREWKKSANMRE